MTYDWPRGGRPQRRDDRRGRVAHNARTGASTVPPAQAPASAADSPVIARAVGSRADDLWSPIGPQVVLGGQASGTPRVTGRVRDVWIEPGLGRRAYAASATGGVWYTDDAGSSWRALGGWRTADPNAPSVSANPLASGCLWVDFGRTSGVDDPVQDEVWVGTGEDVPNFGGNPGRRLGGVGILHAVDPTSRSETDSVFVVEATNLFGAGVLRLARHPGDRAMAAATSAGLVERPSGSGPEANWGPAAGVPTDGSSALPCTDVVWTPAVAGHTVSRMWAALRRRGTKRMELWCRPDGGAFARIPLPPGPAPATDPEDKLVLAASPSGDTLWVLGSAIGTPLRARLWRIDTTAAAPAGVLVSGTPRLWGDKALTASKMAVAVDPSNPARIAIGGTAVGESAAALSLGAVTSPAAGTFAYPAGAHVGDSVHPDVLAIRFTTDGSAVWVACDGGVFVSTARGAPGSFAPRNDGLAVVEAGYVACQPDNDHAVILGAQDNATQRRVGEALWKWEQAGDGGGIAFDRVATHRYVAQFHNADWSNGPDAPGPPVQRATDPADEKREDAAASFYSTPATIANGAVNQLSIGTDRVWYTEDWGATWATVPTGTDPRKPTLKPAQDVLPTAGGPVRVLRWSTPTELWVLAERALYRFRRTGTAWGAREEISLADVFHPAKKTDVAKGDLCNDIAVFVPAPGAPVSVYLAMHGDLSADGAEQLWWFDGAGGWHKTGLRALTTAAALAVAVEDGHPDLVHVGTTIGVFRGRLTITGGDPSWSWIRLDNGLPDVAVQDLAIFSKGPVRLLRAATQARGVWELDLAGPIADRTYLQVHRDDSRRISPTSLVDPYVKPVAAGGGGAPVPVEHSWHASPDIRVHPRLGPLSQPPSLPWNRSKFGTLLGRAETWRLWRFQVALRQTQRRVQPTGLWDSDFEAALVAAGAPLVAGKRTITAAFWLATLAAADLTRPPWEGALPNEADLAEHIPAGRDAADQPGSDVPPGPATVYVMVHHRGFAPAADVQVTLLGRLVAKKDRRKTSSSWLPDPVGWTAAITTLLTTGTVPASLTGGWRRLATRQSPGPVAAGSPRAVAFDVNLGDFGNKGLVLLVAVVHSGADPVALAEAPLRQLVLDRHHVAVRSVDLRV